MAAANLGAKKVTTVHGVDGVDEISLTGKTILVNYQNGNMTREEVTPEDFGFSQVKPGQVAGSEPDENARLTSQILTGKLNRNDPRLQIVLANAAAGLVLCDSVQNIKDGVEKSYQVVSDGLPFKILQDLIVFSKQPSNKLQEFA
jgi:anthranilate phosphoribosyltransferase